MKKALLLNVEDEAEVRANFAQAVRFRKRLEEVLLKEIEEVRKSMESEDNYDSPNWTTKQVGRIERVKAFRQIIGYLQEK